VVLRGGNGKPNYDSVSVALCEQALNKAKIKPNIMVDCSHANSNKDPALQPLVMENVANQIVEGNQSIIGLMVESHLNWGCQAIPKNLEDLYKRSRGEGFGAEVQRRIMVGAYALSAGYYDAYYLKAQKIRRLVKNDFMAAFEEVDATPMEGFDPAQVDEILGLRAKGLRSVTLMPLGYRAAEGDWLRGAAKVRKPLAELVTEIA